MKYLGPEPAHFALHSVQPPATFRDPGSAAGSGFHSFERLVGYKGELVVNECLGESPREFFGITPDPARLYAQRSRVDGNAHAFAVSLMSMEAKPYNLS